MFGCAFDEAFHRLAGLTAKLGFEELADLFESIHVTAPGAEVSPEPVPVLRCEGVVKRFGTQTVLLLLISRQVGLGANLQQAVPSAHTSVPGLGRAEC